MSKYKCVFGVELQVGGDHVPAKLPKSPEPKSKAGAPPNPKALNPLSPKPLDPEVLTPTPSPRTAPSKNSEKSSTIEAAPIFEVPLENPLSYPELSRTL